MSGGMNGRRNPVLESAHVQGQRPNQQQGQMMEEYMIMDAMDGFDNPLAAIYMINQQKQQRQAGGAHGGQNNMMNEMLPLAIMTDAGDIKDLAMRQFLNLHMCNQTREQIKIK